MLIRKPSNAVQIPPPAPVSIKGLVKSLIQKPRDIPRVLKTKKFILARLEGDGVLEAKRKAGFFNTVDTAKVILSSPAAQVLLDELVKEKIPDPAVAERLKEMWDAESKEDKYDPATKTTTEIKKPNWDLRRYAMDKRLALGGYNNGSLPEGRGEGEVVTQINFTTINVDASTGRGA